MSSRSFTVVANWKMSMSVPTATAFFEQHSEEFKQLAQLPNTDIIICPSFTELTMVDMWTKKIGLQLGAQDCSAQKAGAYTGQISAEQLVATGCSYSIVGHSERRIYCHETDAEIAQKVLRLAESGIIPIICIGETKEQYEAGITLQLLTTQITPIFDALKTAKNKPAIIYIAYEPVWSIGTGDIPDKSHLNQILEWLTTSNPLQKLQIPLKFLYGGSVNEQTGLEIITKTQFDGFLVGGASLDFKKFKNIVLLKNSLV